MDVSGYAKMSTGTLGDDWCWRPQLTLGYSGEEDKDHSEIIADFTAC